MASSVWKGYITFGLVSVPVRLFAAARELHVSFNQIHEPCGSRIKQQIFCETCQRVVERSELVKGYAVDRDRYVTVTAEDMKSLEAESSENMKIIQFVKLTDVDPIFFQTSYYSAPEDAGKRAYSLLFQGMREMNVAAIAKVTFNSREQVVIVRPYDKGLLLHTIYFPEEVRQIPEYGSQGEVALDEEEKDLAEMFMKRLIGSFDPSVFKDEYQTRVKDMIASKDAGAAVVGPSHPARGQVINLMDALKKSIQAQDPEAPAKKGPQRVGKEAKPVAKSRKAG